MDSFNNEKTNRPFNCQDNFKELCAANNILLEKFSEVNYKIGWAPLISSTLEIIKNSPVKIIMVDDSYGEIDIKFEASKNKAELETWRVFENARYQSRYICMSCGNSSANIVAVRIDQRLCNTCYSSAGIDGFTGTWLDKF